MRLSFIGAFGLISSIPSFASPTSSLHYKRDASATNWAYTQIQAALDNLDKAFKDRNLQYPRISDDQRIVTLLQSNAALDDRLRIGGREIRRGPMITTTEASAITPKSNALYYSVQNIMTSWKLEKPKAVAVGKQLWVLDELMNFSEAFVIFSDSLTSRLNSTIEQRASQLLKGRFTNIIEAVITDYRLCNTPTCP
jgi:hypothetical protein